MPSKKATSVRSGLAAAMLLAAGCWGYPRLSIRGEQRLDGTLFNFSYCGSSKPPPALLSIAVNETDAQGRAVDPPICHLNRKENATPARVPEWRYGQALPALQPLVCAPLKSGARYLISIAGGGIGSAAFSTDERGRLRSIEEPCR